MKSKMTLVVSPLKEKENGKRSRINYCVPTLPGPVLSSGDRAMNRDHFCLFLPVGIAVL